MGWEGSYTFLPHKDMPTHSALRMEGTQFMMTSLYHTCIKDVNLLLPVKIPFNPISYEHSKKIVDACYCRGYPEDLDIQPGNHNGHTDDCLWSEPKLRICSWPCQLGFRICFVHNKDVSFNPLLLLENSPRHSFHENLLRSSKCFSIFFFFFPQRWDAIALGGTGST